MAQLLYFGKLVDLTGTPSEHFSLPDTLNNTADLRRWLDANRAYAGALLDPSIRLAINDELVVEPCSISDGDQIAFLPPVGGG